MSSGEPSLQRLHREAGRLERNFGALQRTIEQIQDQTSAGGNSTAIDNANVLNNKQALIAKLKKIRESAQLDDNELKSQRITIDQQTKLIDSIKDELISLRTRVTKYMSNNNNNHNNGGNSSSSSSADDAKYRNIIRERLLLLRSELTDHYANEEAAYRNRNNGQTVTVTYFNGRGKCEPIRLMLAAGDIKFENKFVETANELKELAKSGKLYYEQLPLVEIDNMQLTQSGAAIRYIARRCGMYGDSDQERYLIDLIHEGSKDARSVLGATVWKDWNADELLKNFKEKRYFGAWEQQLQGSRSGYFTNRESLADVAVFEVLDYYKLALGKDLFAQRMKSHPKLMNLYELVYKLGRVAAYVDNERDHLPNAQYKRVVNAVMER